jgi:hypothetical protein
LVDLFVAVLFACWLEGGRETERELGNGVWGGRTPRATGSFGCMQEISLSYYLYMFYGIFFWRKRCGFSSLPQPGILIGENIEKTTEFWHFISFAKIPLGSFDAS